MTKKSAAELDREINEFLATSDVTAKAEAYAEKQEAKRDRLEAAASRARGRAASASRAAHQVFDNIPMGQPILVGHHSEGRHRRDLAKADRSMRKSIEADNQAAELAARAAAVGTAGISSDDPEAVKKLKVELNKLRVDQERMKLINVAIRKLAKQGPEAQIAGIVALGYNEATARKVLEKDFAGRIGIPSYAITNNGANIRRIEKRIEELMAKESTPARASVRGEIEGLTFEIAENKEANRTQIVFSGKPSEELRDKLKHAGFRWAPSEGAWQRQLSNGAWYQATHALGVG